MSGPYYKFQIRRFSPSFLILNIRKIKILLPRNRNKNKNENKNCNKNKIKIKIVIKIKIDFFAVVQSCQTLKIY